MLNTVLSALLLPVLFIAASGCARAAGPAAAVPGYSAENSTAPETAVPAAAVPGSSVVNSTAPKAAAPPGVSTTAIHALILAGRRVRGIHLTSWGSGSPKGRQKLLKHISGTVLNAVVIAIKETDGRVYIPGVEKAEKYGAYTAAIPRPEAMVADFKAAKLYTIARIVSFNDRVLPKARPDLAVKTPDGRPWRSRNGATWTDPYNREVWAYLLDIAERAAKAGFEEIQFDYIRYPSEGNISQCLYSKPHNSKSAVANLKNFLAYARKRLAPYEVKMSVDVFGLTTSAKDDMGIGQDMKTLTAGADFIYPMMYPSHYARGAYGIKNPNASPYRVIDRGLKDAMLRLGPGYAKLRPYLQDFSLFGVHYGQAEVRAQLIAARLNLLESWVLWNPANKYTWSALTPHSYRAYVDPDYK
ncbi:MAG: hypothetical protein COT18_10720 [Elusimicrobia bacterium CG08_land_8_20_14_0_20_59_10]|nr:MAG: hypothetical protein COT18_10720 [Elusimicrobia bacterium CG08_land_8_20_14_0_20_59_10]